MNQIFKNYGFLIPTILGTLFLFKCVFFIGVIPSPSMVPTFEVGTFIGATRNIPDKINRGDIILFHPEVKNRKNEFWIKRVIAIPGDTIVLKNKSVYINGNEIDEPYLKNKAGYKTIEYEVPKNKYFVMGDNRDHSYDSRFFNKTFVSRQNIIAYPKFAIQGGKLVKINEK